jgi:hypothetical protein
MISTFRPSSEDAAQVGVRTTQAVEQQAELTRQQIRRKGALD